jgi:hypothetical protein
VPTPSLTAPGETPTPAATPTPNLRHFQCYSVSRRAFNKIPGVPLDDELGPGTVDVKGPKRLCNPVNKNNEDPSAPFSPDHLVSYGIRQTAPRFTRVEGLRVANQFGTFVIDAKKPALLMIPSTKSAAAPPPQPVNPEVDHLKCYNVRAARFLTSGVQVQDQFGTLSIDVRKPSSLCVPANKNGEGILNPAAHLLCYRVRTTPRTPKFQRPGSFFVANQLGPNSFVVRGLRELCVPSVRIP